MVKLLCIDHVTKILGGAELNLLQLLDDLDRNRFSPMVACVKESVLANELDKRSVRQSYFELDQIVSEFRLVNRRFAFMRGVKSIGALQNTANQLAEIGKQEQTELFLSITNKDHFAAGIAARRLGIPSIWWINDIIAREFFSPIVMMAFSFMARRYASHLVTVSERGKEALISLGIKAKKITTIHNGIDANFYQRTNDLALRHQLGIPDDAFVVTTLGRITPWKGQRIFVQAAKALAKQRPNTYFLIIGGIFNEDQAYADSLKADIASANLGSRLQLVEFCKDVTQAYAASNLFVHCALKPEPFGRVLIEAMSSEVPVVGARDGGVKEIIKDGETGIFVTPGNVEEYINAMSSLIDNPQRTLAMGKRGREDVINRFSLKRTVSQFETLMEKMAVRSAQKPATR